MACHNKYMAKHSIKTEASERLQEIVTKNIRVRLALYNVKQTTLAEALLQTQAGLSAKINRKSEWTVADIANAAAFFHEPVENLITSSTLDAISGGSEYQVEHNVPVDISRRELSAPAGSRTSVLNVQVLEDEHKSPLLKWDRTFSLSGSIRGGVEYLMRGNLASDISRYGVDPTGSSAMAMRRLAA